MSKPKQAKLVQMIPIRRCGSHAIRLRLNFSPEFYSPYPLHIVDFMPLAELYGDLSDDFTYFQLIIDLVGLQNATMIKWDGVALDPVKIFEALKNSFRSVHAVVWQMLRQAGKQYNAKVVMNKSLDNVHYAEELISLFPNIKFLYVVRDPRAQINSINLSILHHFHTLLNTLIWVKAQDAATALVEQYPQQVLTIRYEDFLTKQEVTLKKICEFIGIDFLSSMLDVSASQEAQKIAVLFALWETNSSAPIQSYIDKFKQQLSIEEIAIIETLTGGYMDKYGYTPMTSADFVITQEAMEKAKQQDDAKKTAAWQKLKFKDPRDYQLRKFRADYLNMLKQRLLIESFVDD